MSKTKKVRGLFITPDLSYHGGDISLYGLLNSVRQIEADLMIPFWCHNGSRHRVLSLLEEQNLKEIKRVFFRPLPRKYRYIGAPQGMIERSKEFIKDALWMFYKKKFLREIDTNQYDFIHLNSTSLYPMITNTNEIPCIVHVREMFDLIDSQLLSALKEANGLIFIDQPTKNCIQGLNLPEHKLLINPINMKKISSIDVKKVREKHQIPLTHQTISIIGSITSVKGVDQVIKAFRQTDSQKKILLIVGGEDCSEKKYFHECFQMAQGDKRIRFLGHRKDIESIFAISDFIVRGDPIFALGRTTFEGLYAGCSVILPGTEIEINGCLELEPFREQVFGYEVGSQKSLSTLLQNLPNKNKKRHYLDNCSEYGESFEEFVSLVLRRGKEHAV